MYRLLDFQSLEKNRIGSRAAFSPYSVPRDLTIEHIRRKLAEQVADYILRREELFKAEVETLGPTGSGAEIGFFRLEAFVFSPQEIEVMVKEVYTKGMEQALRYYSPPHFKP